MQTSGADRCDSKQDSQRSRQYRKRSRDSQHDRLQRVPLPAPEILWNVGKAAGGEACHALAQKCQIRSAATIKASFLVGGMTPPPADAGAALKLPLKAGASKA